MPGDTPTSFPLAWPIGWPRTRYQDREHGSFSTTRESRPAQGKDRKPITVVTARERLSDELDRLGARSIVLSTNLELRLDGLPRGDTSNPTDPGAAVYFQRQNKPIVLACDNFVSVAANIAAVAAHIAAMRGMARWKVGSVEQLFTGYTALPSAVPAGRPWWQVLGFSGPLLPHEPASLAYAEDAYRKAMKTAHPDAAGGSHERAAALNAAIEEARKILK